MHVIQRILRRMGDWLGLEVEEELPADSLLTPRASERADAAFAALRANCQHLSATGIDETATTDPAKVWRCDNCGLLHRHLLDPNKPWITLGIEPVEVPA